MSNSRNRTSPRLLKPPGASESLTLCFLSRNDHCLEFCVYFLAFCYSFTTGPSNTLLRLAHFALIYIVSSIFYSLLFHLIWILRLVRVCSCSSCIFTAEFHCTKTPEFIHSFSCQWTIWVVSRVLPSQAMLLWAHFYLSCFLTCESLPKPSIILFCFNLPFPGYWRGGASFMCPLVTYSSSQSCLS